MEDKSVACYSTIKKFHTNAFGHISSALELEESDQCGSREAKLKALRLYKAGTEQLGKGIDVTIPPSLVGTVYGKKALRIRDKMTVNLDMTRDRIRELEDSLGEKKDSGAARPLGRPAARRVTATRPPAVGRTGRSPVARIKPADAKRAHNGLSPSGTSPSVRPRLKHVKGVDDKLSHIILDQIMDSTSDITFDDIAGLEAAKKALEETVILPAVKPELFTGLRSPAQGLLLYGPPGNGKTLLAKAVACEANCKFFNISASALTSKWVGEAEKLVKALFTLARELQPSIVFIDEVDSILCERRDSENEVSRRLKTEFLLQFDGVESNSGDRILVMAATNRPFELDDAVLRRFPIRILISQPDFNARMELLQKLLSKHDNPLSLHDLRSIARLTEGYSGSDLKNLAKDAAMGPIREIPAGKVKSMNAEDIRRIHVDDFRNSIARIKPSTHGTLVQKLLEFDRAYGEGQAR